MSGDLSSHGDDGGTSLQRLSPNSPELLPHKSFHSVVHLIMKLGRLLRIVIASPSPMEVTTQMHNSSSTTPYPHTSPNCPPWEATAVP